MCLSSNYCELLWHVDLCILFKDRGFVKSNCNYMSNCKAVNEKPIKKNKQYRNVLCKETTSSTIPQIFCANEIVALLQGFFHTAMMRTLNNIDFAIG